MRIPIFTSRFEKDVKVVKKRGWNIPAMKKLIYLVLEGNPLPRENNDHALTGNWKGRRGPHIEPDWVLIYKIDGDTVIFERTGSHSDLYE